MGYIVLERAQDVTLFFPLFCFQKLTLFSVYSLSALTISSSPLKGIGTTAQEAVVGAVAVVQDQVAIMEVMVAVTRTITQWHPPLKILGNSPCLVGKTEVSARPLKLIGFFVVNS